MKKILYMWIITFFVFVSMSINISLAQVTGTDVLSGKVAETMHSGGYTYIKFEKDGSTTWVAIPKTEVTVGQDISLYPGVVMHNFRSKTLNRTFESIVFSSGIIMEDKAVKQGHHGSSLVIEKEEIKVQKAEGPDAYTVSEIYSRKSELDGKRVMVKGKVVKVSESIMDTNWIHIQDGSGDPQKGEHDLIVTSDDIPKVGDIITVSGTLRKDKDIGSGYRFGVLIEDAEIKK
jgi:hypothetical protein